MVGQLILILGDQLSDGIAALKRANKATDRVVMAEALGEGQAVPHHPQKIVLILTAMRKFADRLRSLGWTVDYSTLDDPANSQTLAGEILRRASENGSSAVIATAPGDWRLRQMLEDLPLRVTVLPDDRFLCSEADFAAWAKDRKALRMEWFYRDMRRKTGLLMVGEQPEGGQWNYDHDNRKPAVPDLFRPKPPRFAPDETTRDVMALVARHFPNHFGEVQNFDWATTPEQANEALDHFIQHSLPRFGDEQDAMLRDDPFLSHSLLSPYINLGLLDPLHVCQRAEAEYHAGRAPLNAVEGFIRQIIGWREYVRGIWSLHGPEYLTRNALGHQRPLPWAYWGGETHMACVKAVVRQTQEQAYAHHIQRLMVTGNFALLAGVDPAQVHAWYLSVYIDALEWVEAPNTLGMSQWADGGVIASKPYVSSGAYIDRMGDYCQSCAYDVRAKSGAKACPFNLLYWHFLDRQRDRFATNPRMAMIYRTWDKMAEAHRRDVLAQADALLDRLDAGGVV
ncbi:cryptochrome/photolyase family protein [Neogemmobacter tilapiae]|uniref:Deoxyribodipyrimidine photo-lyase n=1 Tax=Neogemmobacter tilapiae TaxID=875041 RepID=A0A918WJF6_9RHOB|nr:cryptochrome/photolyase family protein [Gemmobacter tilapiae]GHC48474.1 deoxyribodipyrimidine photo-lyase [Gemmobacter tilapiae]